MAKEPIPGGEPTNRIEEIPSDIMKEAEELGGRYSDVNPQFLARAAQEKGVRPGDIVEKWKAFNYKEVIENGLSAIEKMMTVEEVVAALGKLDSKLLRLFKVPEFGQTSEFDFIKNFSVKILGVDCTAYYRGFPGSNIIRLSKVEARDGKAPILKLQAIDEINTVFMKEGEDEQV